MLKALWRQITQNEHHPLPLRDAPYPCPIQHTPFSIDFEEPGLELEPMDVNSALGAARGEYLEAVRQHSRNGVLEPRSYECKSVEFGIAAVATQPGEGLVWNDAFEPLKVSLLKSNFEGFSERSGRILDMMEVAWLGPRCWLHRRTSMM